MLISVKVVPNSSKNRIVKEGEKLKVYVNSPAADGKANKTLIGVLAEFFEVKKGAVRIVKGEKSREKIIEIST